MKRRVDRAQRVGDLICRALANILLEDMTDERFRLVTVMGANVSRDLSYAKIYVSALMDDENQIRDTIKSLNNSVKRIRYQLAKAVELRIVPELKFVYDDTTARGFHISGLIDEAVKKSNK